MESKRAQAVDLNGKTIEFTLDWNEGAWTMDAIDEDMDPVDNSFSCSDPDEDTAISLAKAYINENEF